MFNQLAEACQHRAETSRRRPRRARGGRSGPPRDVLALEGVADGCEADVGRADLPRDARSRVRDATPPRGSPASRVVFLFSWRQSDRAHTRIMPRRRRDPGRSAPPRAPCGPRFTGPLLTGPSLRPRCVQCRGREVRPGCTCRSPRRRERSRSRRSSARWDRRPVEIQPARDVRQRRLGGLAARLGHRAHRPGLLRQPAVRRQRVDRRQLAARRRDGALEVRRLRVEHPVEVAPQRARDAPGLQLQQRRAGPDATRIGDRLTALPDTMPRPRARATTPQADRGQALRHHRGVGHRDHELEMGRPPARLTTRGPEPASQPCEAAVLRGALPSR